MLHQTCQKTGEKFMVFPHESTLYDSLGVPLPQISFAERDKLRMAWRNERKLYKRTCDATGKPIISFYHPKSDFPVYEKNHWWSDAWDPMAYGMDFDFGKTFAENWAGFRDRIPRMGMMSSRVENDYFGAYSVDSRNLYCCVSCVVSEDLMYCYQVNQSRDCIDCALCVECELCYECFYCTNGYNLKFSLLSENCSDSWFLKNCIGCRDCFGCVNLRNKQYYFLNEPCTKAEYTQKIEALKLGDYAELQKLRTHFSDFCLQHPVPHINGKLNENVTGNMVQESRNSDWLFECRNLEDCFYCGPMPALSSKNCADCMYSPGSELTVNNMSGVSNYRTHNMLMSWDMKESAYCDECFYSQNCFGCAGLRKATHCIFNKSFTAQEYEIQIQKIETHMRETGEWGQFFAPQLSPFAYNETIAQDWYPLTQATALKQGFKWREDEKNTPQAVEGAMKCAETDRYFKLQPQEENFYQKLGLPAPELHPDVRHEKRMQVRFPRQLWERKCASSNVAIMSTYGPNRPEKVLEKSVYETQTV